MKKRWNIENISSTAQIAVDFPEFILFYNFYNILLSQESYKVLRLIIIEPKERTNLHGCLQFVVMS